MQSKLAVITGSARGQGLAMARWFTDRGATVVLCDVLESQGTEAVRGLAAQGHDVRFFRHDVSSADSWRTLVRETIAWRNRIDILVNNAGIVKRKNITTYNQEDWHHVIEVNLTGAFYGIQHVTPHMRAAGGGAIVNISSNAGISAHPDVAYAVSKWGLRGLTKATAMELAADRIRVNCVCPGVVRTDANRGAPHLEGLINLTPLGRSSEPAEIAAAVGFLAGDDAAMITGEEIVVDGGFSAGGGVWRTSTDAGFYAS